MKINQIIGYFLHSQIKFINIFATKLAPFSTDMGRTTAQGVCGLVLPIKGCAHFSLNGTTYAMNEHTILHAGSKMDIKIETFDQEWEYAVVHYHVHYVPEEWESIYDRHFMLTTDKTLSLENKIYFLQTHQTQLDYMSQLQVQNAFMNLVETILLSARNGRIESKKDAILEALEYFQIHYGEEISICEVAEKFGMNRRRFTYLFEQLTGFSPMEYLIEYRMSRAKELLTTSDFPIAIVAEMVGYMDSFYFSRLFKKYTSMSPSAYRKKHGRNPNFHLQDSI